MKIQIDDARKLIRRSEREVADIEQDEKCTKDDEQKCKASYRIAQVEVEKVSNQIKATKVV